MDAQYRHIVDAMKKEMSQAAGFMKQANANVPVSGTRIELPLQGRTLDAVWYQTEEKNAPLILGFHGGGFLFGGSAMDDGLWSAVTKELRAHVISVNYRMSPEHQYPAPIEDAYDSAVYLRDHSAEFGFDPAHISVMGSSAGANISAAVCIYAKEHGGIRFDQQILVYPFLDAATEPLEKGYTPQEAGMYYVFNELYVAPERAKEACCSPRFASDTELTGLPRVILCPAEQDILCREGQEYGRRLRALGIEVAEDEPAAGMPHGYFEYGFSDGNGMSADFLPEEMKAMIEDGTMRRAAEKTLKFIAKNFYRA